MVRRRTIQQDLEYYPLSLMRFKLGFYLLALLWKLQLGILYRAQYCTQEMCANKYMQYEQIQFVQNTCIPMKHADTFYYDDVQWIHPSMVI